MARVRRVFVAAFKAKAAVPPLTEAIAAVKESGALDPRGVDSIWTSFLRQPEKVTWSGAFLLVVLGNYMKAIAAGM